MPYPVLITTMRVTAAGGVSIHTIVEPFDSSRGAIFAATKINNRNKEHNNYSQEAMCLFDVVENE